MENFEFVIKYQRSDDEITVMKTCVVACAVLNKLLLLPTDTEERLNTSQNPYGSKYFLAVLGQSLCRLGASESFGSMISTFCACSWPRIRYNRPRKVCRGILSWFS